MDKVEREARKNGFVLLFAERDLKSLGLLKNIEKESADKQNSEESGENNSKANEKKESAILGEETNDQDVDPFK